MEIKGEPVMKISSIYRVVLSGIAIVILWTGCAGNSTLLYKKLQNEQTIEVKTVNGTAYKGSVMNVDDRKMTILTRDNQQKTIPKEEIRAIIGPAPVYDEGGILITETEIANVTRKSSFYSYLLGGSVLSFGCSFFLGSLIDRQVSDNDEDQGPIMWSVAGIGAVVGSTIFSVAGTKKDRHIAIEKIRDQRRKSASSDLEKEKERQRNIKEELEKVKKQREQQEKELQDIKEKLKDIH